ncbi:MAG: hypothetical protein JWM16_1943, partial [Verrucomicrobiales bacterium]|nr:hypothetical protein [Verrucomicrobiales bacterium]
LPTDAYVWQRSWTDGVTESVMQHPSNLTELVVLGAEVSWKGNTPRITHMAVNTEVLREHASKIGLALRIGSYPGPFRENDAQAQCLTGLAAALIREAATNGLRVAELQIDFDCAESKLDGYATWLAAIRRAVDPVPVTITALPAWLKQPGFKRLIEPMEHYVLQVHSLERPRDVNAHFELCESAKARQAVEQAGRLGKPFRVALPTYGYMVAFDKAGRFMGLSAEGPAPNWPGSTRLREVRSSPESMTALVRAWSVDRPSAMTGLIWYRLPVEVDRLNWGWTTLASVMAGNLPHAALRAEVRKRGSPLVEVEVVNTGTADDLMPQQVTLSWESGGVVAGDGVQGFELAETGSRAVRFELRNSRARLQPGERRLVGWIRFKQETEVKLDVLPSLTPTQSEHRL